MNGSSPACRRRLALKRLITPLILPPYTTTLCLPLLGRAGAGAGPGLGRSGVGHEPSWVVLGSLQATGHSENTDTVREGFRVPVVWL